MFEAEVAALPPLSVFSLIAEWTVPGKGCFINKFRESIFEILIQTRLSSNSTRYSLAAVKCTQADHPNVMRILSYSKQCPSDWSRRIGRSAQIFQTFSRWIIVILQWDYNGNRLFIVFVFIGGVCNLWMVFLIAGQVLVANYLWVKGTWYPDPERPSLQ